MKQIPNLFTLLNLVFGCLAIVFTLQNGITITGDGEGTVWIDIPEKIWFASLFIGLAALVDFLDGFLARLLNANSEMGQELDSLADLVSFGVAPGMIFYQFLRLSLAKESNALDASMIWLVPAFIVPCAAAWRLARFNIEHSIPQAPEKDPAAGYRFKGMPVPATGIFVASLPLIYWNVNVDWVQSLLMNRWALYAVIGLLSGLMVSRLPLMALKFRDFSLKNNFAQYLLLLLAVVGFVLIRWPAIPLTVLAYFILSLLFQKKTTLRIRYR